MLGHASDAPVLQHAVVQEVLADRGQLVLQHLVEMLDDILVAFHDLYFLTRLVPSVLRLSSYSRTLRRYTILFVYGLPAAFTPAACSSNHLCHCRLLATAGSTSPSQ